MVGRHQAQADTDAVEMLVYRGACRQEETGEHAENEDPNKEHNKQTEWTESQNQVLKKNPDPLLIFNADSYKKTIKRNHCFQMYKR